MTDAENSSSGFKLGKGLLVGAGVALTGLASLAMLLIGAKRHKEAAPMESPSGKYVLTTGVNHDKVDPTRYLCVTVTIKNADGESLHHEVTPCSHLHKWSIKWTSDEEIQLDSSDVGRYVLTRETGDLWVGKLLPAVESSDAGEKPASQPESG